MVEEHNFKFEVQMNCGGCSGSVERVLRKLDGVKSYAVSLEMQTATVITRPELEYETVLQAIKEAGKTVRAAEADGEKMAV